MAAESTSREFVTTKLEALARWAESGSLWPLPFGTACCAIEFMAAASSRYDIARFGSEVLRFSPRQSDLLLVMGTITDKMAPVLVTIYNQMAEPRWVIAMGACTVSGGFYRSYHVVQGIDELIPVDVYIPGCPPTPEALLHGIIDLQRGIQDGTLRPDRPRRALHDRTDDASVMALAPPSPALIARSQRSGLVSHPWVQVLEQRFPGALLGAHDDQGDLTVRLGPQMLKPVLAHLRDSSDFDLDLLLDICAVDYLTRRPRFEVVYHLTSLAGGHRLRLTVPLEEEQLELPTVTDLYKAAGWFEREVFDLFGVRFLGHPDLRRILTHDGFGKIHPMRRDYPPGLRQPFLTPATLPVAEGSPVQASGTHLEAQPLILNIGPSHPATHGVFRIVARLDGETVEAADVELGYLHRNFEKMAETHTYHNLIPYCDRLNYMSSFINGAGFAMAVEKMIGIEVPVRARRLRVILSELSRIMDHVVCIGTNLMDMGLISSFFYLWNLREEIYDLLEECSGARMMVSYVRIGGLAEDVPADFEARVLAILDHVPPVLSDTDRMVTHNPIAKDRMRHVGAISRKDAIAYGFTGPCLRASGEPYDLRRAHPYLDYDQFDFDIPVGSAGDVYDRYLVRMEEIRQSLRIVRQALADLPEGAVASDDRRVILPPKSGVYTNIEDMMNHFKLIMEGIRPPVGEVYGFSEAANGELGFYIISDGGPSPYRVKVRPPSFAIYQAFPEMMRGMMVSDVVATLGSLNIIAGESER